MSRFFDVENPLFSLLSKVADMLFVSIAFILLTVPIITIGPAYTALYYSVVKVIRRERGYLFREFFRSFKLNFKRATIIGVLLTLVFLILAFDLSYAWELTADPDSNKGSLLLGVFVGIFILAFCIFIYVFPILSRFDMTVKQLIKASMFMSTRHLHFTILMLAVHVAALVVIYFFLPFIFFAPAIVVFVNSLMMEKIFKKYMPESEGPGEETGKDEWYLE